jgi:D-cysteine desulfhydrase
MMTPLHRMTEFSNRTHCNIYIKRDDLYPMTGGGNKARKISYMAKSIKQQHKNAVITTGGTQSNHARVVALLAAENNWPCHLILHGDPSDLDYPTGNLLISMLSGANIEITSPNLINEKMKKTMTILEEKGYLPYEIPGGCHCIEGSMAYYEAIHELSIQCKEYNLIPDYIIHASGTGTTQAGILAGIEKTGWHTNVIGISVARRNPRGIDIVSQSYDDIRRYNNLSSNKLAVTFYDNWVGLGYEKADNELLSFIKNIAQTNGLILDPTYSGKAFLALNDLILTSKIAANSSVLFWHTGGLLNLLSSSYFKKEN